MFFDWLSDMIALAILAAILFAGYVIWLVLQVVFKAVRDFLRRLFGKHQE